MYNGMQVYRAVVTSSSSTTGSLYVSIPSVLGTTTSIAVSTIGRAAVSGVWTVPDVGDQVVVAVEDDKFSNVFLLYPVEPPVINSTSIADGSITAAKLANNSVVNEKLDMYRLRARRVAPQVIQPLSAQLIEFDTIDFEKYNNDSVIGALPSQAIFPQTGLYAISVKVTTSATAGTQTAMLTVDNFVSATPLTSFAGAFSIVLTCNMFFYGSEVLSLKVTNSNSSLTRSYTAMLSMILLTE